MHTHTHTMVGPRLGFTVGFTIVAMPQGKFKPAKVSGAITKQKSKPVKGDQQKLKRGNLVIKPKGKAAAADFAVQQKITKQINSRIEATMTARTGGEGAGLRVLKEDTEGQSLAAPLKSSSFSAKQKGKK